VKPHRRRDAAGTEAAGRVCPIDYVYPPSALNRAPELETDVLYVIGGLYGNLAALSEIERLAAHESGPVTIVFNGDYHWFDAEPAWFAEIERGVARHTTIRGNVETEIVRPDDAGAGCGCAYPADVEQALVDRSNAIHADLRSAAGGIAEHFPHLPMHRVARVGRLRIGIVHGDAGALAGWRFAHDALDDSANTRWLDDVRAQSQVDIFASTHTCLPALRDFALPSGRLTMINNGAAGMANFAGTTHGLITRIAIRPSPHSSLYGLVRDTIFIDAVAVEFDLAAFLTRFDQRWPVGSAAHLSYRRRIVAGPSFTVAQARGEARPAA
jgi:hypothetical protein